MSNLRLRMVWDQLLKAGKVIDMQTDKLHLATTLITLLAVSLVSPLQADQDSQPSKPDPKLVEANTQFALDLYARLRTGDGNIFFSPLSLSTMLAMTYAGAAGNTAKEMQQALHFDLEPAKLHPAMAALLAGLEAPKDKAAYQLSIANALWVEQSYGLLPDYVSLCQDRYRAAARPVDFKTAAESQRQTINDWVAQQTNNKITDLLAPGILRADTRLVLTNAVYFKGTWKAQFDPARTKDEAFTLTGGKSVQAPMMQQTQPFGYAEQSSLQALEMPYAGDALSMVILLPREAGGLANLEKTLSAKTLGDWLGKLRKQKVAVFVPRFTTTLAYRLGPDLQALGMRDAFSPSAADFSGMSGKKDLCVSFVVHKAFVDVNELGTEAAAASGMGLVETTALKKPQPIPVFRADHPFIFLIRDARSGSILFLGRVMNPRA